MRNAFCNENRAKEFGLYFGISRFDRKNIQLLSFIELFVFAVLSRVGLILGVILPCGIIYDSIETHSIRRIWDKYSFHSGSTLLKLLTMAAIFVLVFF